MASNLQFTLLAELLAQPEEEHPWIVENRLPSNGLSILAGKPKAGKSTLARSLAVAVARGEPWLGLSTRQGPVLYLAMEEKKSEVCRHFKQMGATEEPIHCCMGLAPEDGLDQLTEWTKKLAPALVIVDPLVRLMRIRDANEYATVTKALDPLLALARASEAHILAVHHTGKSGERARGDTILGSTAFLGTVDTALFLTMEANGDRWLSSSQRYGEEMPETRITIDPETQQISLKETHQEAQQTRLADQILLCLAEGASKLRDSEIYSRVKGAKATKQQALADLRRSGRVKRHGVGVKNDPFLYELSDSSSPAPIGAEQETEKPSDPPSMALGSMVEDIIGSTWLKQLTPTAQAVLIEQLSLPKDSSSGEEDDDLVC